MCVRDFAVFTCMRCVADVPAIAGDCIHRYLCCALYQDEKRTVTMFVATGVPADFPFAPRTRKEISKIDWFRLDELDGGTSKFWGCKPVLFQLRAWIATCSRRPAKHAKPASTRIVRNAGVIAPPPTASKDVLKDSVTFGEPSDSSWSVEKMFAVNEQLTGRKFTYDGSAQTFGDVPVVRHAALKPAFRPAVMSAADQAVGASDASHVRRVSHHFQGFVFDVAAILAAMDG